MIALKSDKRPKYFECDSMKMTDYAETFPEWAFLSAEKISVIPPSLKTLDGKITIIQISGEGLWQWRKISSKSDAFAALNGTLLTLGYSLLPASKCRIAKCLYQSIQEFAKKMSSKLIGKAARDRLKSDKVYELFIQEAEIGSMPKNVIDDLKQKREELETEIVELNRQLEEQSRKVYEVLVQQVELERRSALIDRLGNKGQKIQNVSERQARRKLTEIR